VDHVLTHLNERFADIMVKPLKTFRGDSFQGVIGVPSKAVEVTVYARLFFLAVFRSCKRKAGNRLEGAQERTNSELAKIKIAEKLLRLDVRLSIAVGFADLLEPDEESWGAPFVNSGSALDKIKQWERTTLIIPSPEGNSELQVACSFLDALASRWTDEQLRVLVAMFQHKNQKAVAKELGKTQGTVSVTLAKFGYRAIEALSKRFAELIHLQLSV